MTINSKRKGKVGELELAEFLRDHGYENAARGQQFKGGADSPDVCGIPGLHIECKRVEALRIYAALDQSTRDAGSANIPMVAHRASRKPWVAILALEAFLEIWKKANAF